MRAAGCIRTCAGNTAYAVFQRGASVLTVLSALRAPRLVVHLSSPSADICTSQLSTVYAKDHTQSGVVFLFFPRLVAVSRDLSAYFIATLRAKCGVLGQSGATLRAIAGCFLLIDLFDTFGILLGSPFEEVACTQNNTYPK